MQNNQWRLFIKYQWEYEDEEAEDYEWEYETEDEEEDEDEDKGKDEDKEQVPLDEQDLPDPFSTAPLSATTKSKTDV